ncbi:hypothetical protein GYMLUDRAFT_70696 [Collybiopsis luxurians FD-317 M1]|nr:hypothetical protein GYMLUDRAFT_70696 [Collybiopsis luxurians FD-317 M1]
MALVNRQHSIALLFPSKLSSPRSNRSRPSSAASSSSSSSSSPSIYSFYRTSGESTQASERSRSSAAASHPTTFLGPSKTRNSCLSEFCVDCRHSHMRRKPKPKPRVIRPLPPLPPPRSSIRPLPRPTGVRKLPSLPSPGPGQVVERPLPQSRVTEVGTSVRHSKKPLEEDLGYDPHFIPEIDWDTIMIEIVRSGMESGSNSDWESDADSIYTDATAD